MSPTVYQFALRLFLASVVGWQLSYGSIASCLAQAKGSILIDFLDKDTNEVLPCRVKILDARLKDARPRGVLMERGWSLVEGTLEFRGRPGDYTYQVFHGPQFSTGSGGFTLDSNAEGEDAVRLIRHSDLEQEGWIAGDLLSHVEADKTSRWLPAEDLGMAVIVSEQPSASEDGQPLELEHGRWVNQFSYLDARPGSGLTLHHWTPPAPVPTSLPSSRLIVMAKQAENLPGQVPVHVEIQKLWARDVPIWLASGRIDSIQLFGEHLTYDGKQAAAVTPLEVPDGYYRGTRGGGRMLEKVYWQTLEAGLRIPPTAGSGFGETPSPLGYNRVYAAVASPSAGNWWRAVRDGQTFVTNGPLLRVEINGQLPGHVFSVADGNSLNLDVAVKLTVSDPVEYLDVIFNGQTLYQARLDEFAKQGGRIPPLPVSESGWCVVRVVTERDFTYRLATTAPYYIEVADQPRITRTAIKFFMAWLEKSAEQLAEKDEATRVAAEPYVNAARRFWQSRLESATAD